MQYEIASERELRRYRNLCLAVITAALLLAAVLSARGDTIFPNSTTTASIPPDCVPNCTPDMGWAQFISILPFSGGDSNDREFDFNVFGRDGTGAEGEAIIAQLLADETASIRHASLLAMEKWAWDVNHGIDPPLFDPPADPAPVPEPTSLFLLSAGFIVVTLLLKYKDVVYSPSP